MNKKIYLCAILSIFAIFLCCSFSFAENENSVMKNTADGIKNMVGNAENAIENTAKGASNTSKNVTGSMQNAGNTAINNVGNTMKDAENAIMGNNENTGFMGTSDDNTDGYTSARTSSTDDTSVMGLNSTTWIWLILALATVGIGILIYSYFAQTNSTHHNKLED